VSEVKWSVAEKIRWAGRCAGHTWAKEQTCRLCKHKHAENEMHCDGQHASGLRILRRQQAGLIGIIGPMPTSPTYYVLPTHRGGRGSLGFSLNANVTRVGVSYGWLVQYK
jgi:hypothetical protein